MTIPTDPAEIANLKKIAELNNEAGDWAYTPVVDPPPEGVSPVKKLIEAVGNRPAPKPRKP